MTEDQKVMKMFEVRKLERPDLADAAERIEPILFNRNFTSFHAMLKMYNERFKNEPGYEISMKEYCNATSSTTS
jgi:hypothetical protein